jgi:predicted acylesterase/phospholipase RssA
MRGVYASTYLGELAAAFARKRSVGALDIGKGFDLIAGTSTGAIVACALAAGVPLPEVVSLYREHGHAIFPRKLPTRFGFSLMAQLFTRPTALASGAKALREVLEVTFRSETLEEVYARRGIALAIPAVEMNRHHSWVFKTPHHPNTNGRDNRYRLADVCLATTAAPIFRSLAPLDDPNGGPGYFVFADGGLWANNPVIVGLVETLELATPEQPIEIFASGRAGARPANGLTGRRSTAGSSPGNLAERSRPSHSTRKNSPSIISPGCCLATSTIRARSSGFPVDRSPRMSCSTWISTRLALPPPTL